MRAIYSLLLSLFTFSCSPYYKVLTYNIYHGENPYHKGNSNLDDVSKLMREANPDVVFLQEVDSMTNRTAGFNDGRKVDIAKELGTLTQRNGYFAKAIDYSEGAYGEGILLRRATEIIRLSLPNPEGGEGRALIASTEKIGKKEVIVAGTHLCHQYSSNRIAQVKDIIEYFKKSDKPMIVGGDFNFRPNSQEYALMNEYFYDAAILGNNVQDTFDADKPKGRIDFIFLSKNSDWTVKEVKTIHSLASDHLPLIAKVRLK